MPPLPLRCLLYLPLYGQLLLADSVVKDASGDTVSSGDAFSDSTYDDTGSSGGSLGDVIALLQEMLQDFEVQSEDDKADWQRYQEWSNKAEASRREIAHVLASSAVQSQAVLASDENEVQELSLQLQALGTESRNSVASIKEVSELRKDARNEYTQSTADLIKTIAAVRKAIDVVTAQKAAGVKATIPEESLLLVRNALAMYGSNKAPHAPNVATFLQGATRSVKKLRGHGSKNVLHSTKDSTQAILDTLVDLRVNLEAKQGNQLSEEGYAVRRLTQARSVKSAELARAQKEIVEKAHRKSDAEAGEKLSGLEVKKTRAGIRQMADDLKALEPEHKRLYDAFTRRLGDRLEDAQATRKALGILTGIAPSLDQSVTFVQIWQRKRLAHSHRTQNSLEHSSRTQSLMALEAEVAKLSLNLKSPQLAQAASLLAAQQNLSPNGEVEFDVEGVKAVGRMLEGVLQGLEDKNHHESSQHHWCALEVKNAKASQEEHDKRLSELRLKVKLLSSEVEQLQSSVDFLDNESKQAALEAKSAVEIQAQQRGSFERAVGDYSDAIDAMKAAMQAVSSQQSLLQSEAQDDAADQKATGGTVMLQSIGMSSLSRSGQGEQLTTEVLRTLDQLIQRYSSTHARLVADDELATKGYKDLLARSVRLKKRTERASVAKAAERRRHIRELERIKAELEVVSVQKTKLRDYFKLLDPSCLQILTTHDGHHGRRAIEIAALRELQHALDDPTDVNQEFHAIKPKPPDVDPEIQGKSYATSPRR